jgi:hypothetical protein
VRYAPFILGLALCTAGVAEGQQRPRRDRNLISQEELQQSGTQDLYQAVRKLRPAWLSSRGATSIAPDGSGVVTKEGALLVYVDGQRRGELDELRAFPFEQAGEIRFLSADQATSRFGMGHPLGAIEVITRR